MKRIAGEQIGKRVLGLGETELQAVAESRRDSESRWGGIKRIAGEQLVSGFSVSERPSYRRAMWAY